MTELTFSCIATVSENCFTSVLHGVWHLWTGKITLHFLVLPQKQYFWCHPTSFLLDLTKCPRRLDPKRTILLHQSTKLHQFSLGQSMCSLANCNLFIFSTMGQRGFLADSFTWAFRLSLITLELIIGWVFSIFFHIFLFFCCHFKAFDIILSSLSFSALLCFPSLINFLIKVRYSFECLERPIWLRFSERNAQYNICCLRP